MSNTKYRIYLCKPDASVGYHVMGTVLAEPEPISFNYSNGLNKPGTASITLHSAALPKAFYNGLESINRQVWIQRGSDPGTIATTDRDSAMVWGGNVVDIQGSHDSRQVTLECEEFTAYYDRLMLTTAFSGNKVTAQAATIADTLLRHEGSETLQMHLVDLSSIAGPKDWRNTTTYFPQWYEYEKHNIGQLVRTILGYLNSDWCQTIGWADSSGQPIVNTGSPLFQTVGYHKPRAFWAWDGVTGTIGRDWDLLPSEGVYEYGNLGGGDTPTSPPTADYPWNEVVFDYGNHTNQTMDEVEWTFSRRNTGTRIRIGGKGERGLQLYQRWAMGSGPRGAIPHQDLAFEDQNLNTQARVDSRGLAIISALGAPQLHVRCKVRQPNQLCSYGKVKIGDRVRVRIRDDGMTWAGKLRIAELGIESPHYGVEYMVATLVTDTSSTQT